MSSDLVRRAFHRDTRPLTDSSLPPAEKEVTQAAWRPTLAASSATRLIRSASPGLGSPLERRAGRPVFFGLDDGFGPRQLLLQALVLAAEPGQFGQFGMGLAPALPESKAVQRPFQHD